jgi:hypothetical protein
VTNRDRAIAFVEANGTELEKARLRWVVDMVAPGRAAVDSLAALQNADGGFPLGLVAGRPTSVDSTLTALWWLEELGLLASVPAGRAHAFLGFAQRKDGGWDENPALAQHDLPPWVRIGDLPTRLYLTAYAAYWLGRRGPKDSPVFRRALDFLRPHQDETGRFRGYLHTTWIATSVFLLAGPAGAAAARQGLAALADISSTEWEASQLAWALSCLGVAGLPAEHSFVARALDELKRRQRQDGSWASEDGDPYAVGATIQAFGVLMRYGRLS